MPTDPKRLIPGTRRDDYEPEVLLANDRARERKWKRATRKKQRHNGKRDVTVTLDITVRQALKLLCKQTGLSQAQLISLLVLEKYQCPPPLPEEPPSGST